MRTADLLDRLLEGAAPADVDVPDDVAELAALADTLGSALSTTATMRVEARDDLRNRLVREANLLAASPPTTTARLRDRGRSLVDRIRYSARAAVAAGTAAAMLSTGGVAVAAQQSLPGDPFHSLKLAGEDLLLGLTDDGTARGAGLLQQSLSRIGEAEAAGRRGNDDSAAAALRMADADLREAARQYLAAYLDTGDTAVLTDIADWVITTGRRLDLMPPLGGDGASALGDLRTSMNRVGQRIEALVTGACTSCDLGVHDDPDGPSTSARGQEADGTPPTPRSSPLDLTIIPAADQPFQACPCTRRSAPGSATPAPAPAGSAPPEGSDPDDTPRRPPASGGSGGGTGGGGGSGGGGVLPVPLPVPDPGPVGEQLPDPVRAAVEEVLEQLPGVDPSAAQAPSTSP